MRNGFSRRDWGLALAITAFAFVLRILGVTFGLPWFHHWDEGWITDNATHMLQSKDWEPRIYQYGAPMPLLMDLVLRALSALEPRSLFDPNDSALMHVIGRVVTVVISSTGAFATYVAGRFACTGDRDATPRAAYGALLYAGAAELVSHGRYAVTDANLAALVAWSLALGALYVRGGRFGWAAGTLIAAALAVAFKVTAGITLAIPMVLFVVRPFAGRKKAALALVVASVPAAAIVFFALNPHMIIHWKAASGDISARINQYREGRVPEFIVRRAGLDHLGAIAYATVFQLFHRWTVVSAGIAALCVFGLARAVRRFGSRVCIVGAAHAVLVVLFMSFSSRAFLVRNYLVVLPVLCVGFGFAIAAVRHRLAGAAALLLVGAVPLAQAIRMHDEVRDTRERAMDWIASHATRPVIVALTPDVSVDATADRQELRDACSRPGVALRDVTTAADVERAHPDFVLVVSHPDAFGRDDVWPFERVRGYAPVASFDANPYEHNFAITPTWMGRFNARVLERDRRQ